MSEKDAIAQGFRGCDQYPVGINFVFNEPHLVPGSSLDGKYVI